MDKIFAFYFKPRKSGVFSARNKKRGEYRGRMLLKVRFKLMVQKTA